MPPFDATLEPLALRGEAIRTSPSGDVYGVTGIEQMARIGPVDYGPIAAGDTATEEGKNIIDLDDELEMDDATFGQFWINPLSDVDIEIRQTEQQEQRFVAGNVVGEINMRTPRNQRVVYVHEDGSPHAIISNNNTYDMDKSLVYFVGFKMVLTPQPLSDKQIDALPGEPATVPTDSLKQNAGGGL